MKMKIIEFNSSNYMSLRLVDESDIHQVRFDILDYVDEHSLSIRLNREQILDLIEYLKDKVI